MDNTDRYLKKTSKVEQEAMLKNSKLQNIEKMQWLKATSYSPDFQRRKGISKKIHVDTSTETADAVLLKDNIKGYSAKESDENLSNDLVPKSNKNTQKEDIDIITLISNTNKLIDQKKKEDEILSIVESIVSAQVEAEFSADKNQTDPADMSQSSETVTEPQTADREVASIKQSDGNNNSTSVTLLSKDNEQHAPCKITDDAEDTKPPVEAKNKDVQKQLGSVSKMKNKSNTSLSKIGEKSSTPGSTSFRKTIVNTSKSPPDRFKPVKSHDCVKKQESLKYEKETRNTTPKSSTEKKNCETESNKTADAQSKSTDKVGPRQHVVPKQFVSKLKGQESHRKNVPTVKQVADKNKQETSFKKEEEEATQSKITDLPSNGSETKEGKTVGEKTYQNNRKATGGGNMRRSTTFVSHYKNSAFKVSQGKDMPRNIDETATSYRRSSLPYTPNNPRFDRFNNGNIQRRAIVKKEYINESYKSNSRIEDRSARNVESCKKQQNEACNQSNRITSESKNSESSNECVSQVDASNVEPVKAKTDVKKHENSDDINNEKTKQASEQREKVVDKSEVDTPQQDANKEMKNKETNSPRKARANKEIKSEETNSLKQSVVNSHPNKFTVESQGGVQKYEQPASKVVENAEYVKDASQFVGSKPTTWNNQTYDNTIQRTIAMNVQQSVQNMQYSLQQERNQMRSFYQPPPWDSSCDNKIQQFPNNNVRYSHLPSTFDATQYEYNGMQAALCDDGAVNAPSALMPMMGVNVEQNPNMMYRYEPNLQQRSVAASSNFSGLTSSQIDEASRWSPSVQNRHLYVHVDQSYNSAPAQHAYNNSTPSEQSYNSTPEHSMHVYNTDINGMYTAQATNCMPHPMIYAPTPCMQPWNSQLQYSIPVVYASPCASYAMVPAASVNQLSNFDNIGPAHDQFKYVPYSRTTNYVKDDDVNGCAAVQMRNNTADNIKSNQYYKQCHDNCRFVYDVPPPMSHSRSQIDTSCTSATMGATHQCNAYRSTNPRYHRQNATNLRKQMQDLGCDDKDSEDIPPIISPKEFVTRSEFVPRGSCNQDQFKNVGCHTPQLQRYNNGNGLRRNPSVHNFSREYTPSVIGRGRNKRI